MSAASPSFPSVIILDPTLPREVGFYLRERTCELGEPDFRAPESWEEVKVIARTAGGAAFVTARRLEQHEAAFFEGADVVTSGVTVHPRGFKFDGPLVHLDIPPPPPPATRDENGAPLFECPELAEFVAERLKQTARYSQSRELHIADLSPTESAALLARTDLSLRREQTPTFRSTEIAAWKMPSVLRLLRPPSNEYSGARREGWLGARNRHPEQLILSAPAVLNAEELKGLLACVREEDTIAWRFQEQFFVLGRGAEEIRHRLAPHLEVLSPAFASTLKKFWPPKNPWTLLRDDCPAWWSQLLREGQECGLDLRALPQVIVGDAAAPCRITTDDRNVQVPCVRSLPPSPEQEARIRTKLTALAMRPMELAFGERALSFLLERAAESDFLVLDGHDGSDDLTAIFVHLGAGHCLSIRLDEFPGEETVPLLRVPNTRWQSGSSYDGGNVFLNLWRTTEEFLEGSPNPGRRRRERIAEEVARRRDDDWDD